MGLRPDLVHDWVDELRRLTLSVSTSIPDRATNNMVMLSLAAEGVAGSAAALLEEAFVLYREKALAADVTGYFYAWVDEMSGTLRCSFCDVPEGAALPFTCATEYVSDMQQIVDLAKSTSYANEIPWTELTMADSFNTPSSAQTESSLLIFRVYIRPAA